MKIVKELLSSKKFVAMIIGMIITIAASVGFNLDPELVTLLVGMVVTYIASQAVADVGKEKAKLQTK